MMNIFKGSNKVDFARPGVTKFRTSLFLLLFLPFIVAGQNQKNDYNTYIGYNNPYLFSILYSQTNYNNDELRRLYGSIKSLHIFKYNAEDILIGETYFDIYKKDGTLWKSGVKNIDGMIIRIAEYAWISKATAEKIIKLNLSFNRIDNKVDTTIWTNSVFDSTSKSMVVFHYRDGKVNQNDSIFFNDNFQPSIINSYNIAMSHESTRRYAYNKSGRIIKTAYQRYNSSVIGQYIKFDDSGHIQFSYKFDFNDFDKIPNFNADKKNYKNFVIQWEGKSFKLRNSVNDSFHFNYDTKKLEKIKKGSTNITYFNNNFRTTDIGGFKMIPVCRIM